LTRLIGSILWRLRILYGKASKAGKSGHLLVSDKDVLSAEKAAIEISERIKTGEALMVSRIGATEMGCVSTYLNKSKSFIKYWEFITGKIGEAWWSENCKAGLSLESGFFPATTKDIESFCRLMLEDVKEIDILGSWLKDEARLAQELSDSVKVRLGDLDPYLNDFPWTRVLEGKRVLVIHPFEETIKSQYKKRELLFSDRKTLPPFDLLTIKAVQGYTNEQTKFNSWFEALSWMKTEIDTIDFDIALLGCGAYGLPLAAHIKRKGKQAIHLGGSLQLLFGIKGKRWEQYPAYAEMMSNEHWVRPSAAETPKNNTLVENGPYW
jgi:hypothetical protein